MALPWCMCARGGTGMVSPRLELEDDVLCTSQHGSWLV